MTRESTLCVVCADSIPAVVGVGRPRKYCDAHRVTRNREKAHEYSRSFYRRNRDKILQYQREYHGCREIREIECAGCGKHVRVFADPTRCGNCVAHYKRRKPDPVCVACGTTFKRCGTKDMYCAGHWPTGPGGHGSAAYRKALAEGEAVIRDVVYERDRWRCRLCGEKVRKTLRWPDPMAPSLDHVMPISKGGTHSYLNVQLAHLGCNWRKGSRKVAS